MSDRFDLQLVSGELLDGMGLDYVSGSYHVFGNNGTHTLGAAIDTGTGAASAVLAARMSASDHLPVVANYRVAPEPTVGVLLLISSLGVLRPRFLGRAKHEILNQPRPCSIPVLTGPGTGITLSATGSGRYPGLWASTNPQNGLIGYSSW